MARALPDEDEDMAFALRHGRSGQVVDWDVIQNSDTMIINWRRLMLKISANTRHTAVKYPLIYR